jgi:hypothetical protein
LSDLATAVCSITATQRRRFFWAAWWTGAPKQRPFRKPDASNGGARTKAEALAEAERVAGRHLVEIEPYWAHAWSRVMRGEAPPPLPKSAGARTPRSTPAASSWSVLGLEAGATLVEVKRAFRQRALETHPDRGGRAEDFVAIQRAYEKLVVMASRPRKRART